MRVRIAKRETETAFDVSRCFEGWYNPLRGRRTTLIAVGHGVRPEGGVRCFASVS